MQVQQRREFFRSLEAKYLRKRSSPSVIADYLTTKSGTAGFLILNAIFFIVWIALNSNVFPGITPFDPYPYGMLTMVVSLEAIMLSLFVLISQNRSAAIGTIRDEIQLQLDIRTEREVTKSLHLLAEIHEHLKIRQDDPELERMLKRTNQYAIERAVVKQIEKANHSIGTAMKKEYPEVMEEGEKS